MGARGLEFVLQRTTSQAQEFVDTAPNSKPVVFKGYILGKKERLRGDRDVRTFPSFRPLHYLRGLGFRVLGCRVRGLGSLKQSQGQMM